jgi:hypothetical protein
MGLKRKRNFSPVRCLSGAGHRGLYRFEDMAKTPVKHLVQDGFLGIEIVVDAAGFDFRRRSDLAQSSCGVALSAK